MISRSFAILRLKRLITMKLKAFVILMIVLALFVCMTGYAIWETIVLANREEEIHEIVISDEEEMVTPVDLPEGISWHAPGIEVGTLYYTITRTSILQNVNNTGIGGIRESAVVGIYDTEGNLTMYHYPECTDEKGDLVEGANLIILDITVTSQDAVNFRTNKATGVQARRYADNPFLFRADEIAYLVDLAEDATIDYTYYDAVYFSQMGFFEEHEMAYEVLPNDSISFRIGYLVGNRPDGSPMDPSDLVITTNWGKAEKEFYDLKLS